MMSRHHVSAFTTRHALLIGLMSLTSPFAWQLLAQSVTVQGTDSAWIAYPKALSKEWGPDNVGRQKSGVDWDRLAQINRMPGISPDYRLGVGDTIEFEVIGMQRLERQITAGGSITVPFLGEVTVVDLNAEEAEQAIAAALSERQMINDPKVLVSITGYESKKVEVLGEVDRPGEYALTSQVTLMDLIFFAGGIDFSAARYGYLHRRGSGPAWRPIWVKAELADLMSRPDVARPGAEVIQVDLQPLKRGGVLERNFLLRDGDLFYVPRRQMEFVYLMGEVNGVGAFELPNVRRVTVTQALSAAGGVTRVADVGNALVVRQEPTGERRDIPVDLGAMLNGKAPDFEVRPNDIIYVPASGGKRLGLNLLNMVPNMMVYLLLF